MRGGRRKLLVVTDLDGSLLDARTYSFEAARPALERLAAAGIPLVLASSKTGAEMEQLARSLPVATALIAENGAALRLPIEPRSRSGYRRVALGPPHERIAAALAEIAAETGAAVRSFSRMTVNEVARLTGLSLDGAALALEREHDEPFLLEDESSADTVVRAAERRGLRISRGGRFWHLNGPTDKGEAFRELLRRGPGGWAELETVGLGDAPNDLPLLQAVDRPILIPGCGGRADRDLVAALPFAEIASAPGPKGWNEAVLAVLDDRELKRAGAVR